MEWLIGGGVAVLLFAAAWWHSGRAKPERRGQHWDRQAELDKMSFQNQRQSQTRGGGNI
jgi:hypothetical protein